MDAVGRFKKWAASDKGKALFRSKIETYGDRKWVEAQYCLMCDWISDNPEKGNKHNWARFVGNWLRRGYSKRIDDIANSKCPGLMTAEQEEYYYKKPREFVKLGNIIKGDKDE